MYWTIWKQDTLYRNQTWYVYICGTVYSFILECWKIRFTAPLRGICASFNSRIQALKLCIHYYIDIHLKDVILPLSMGVQK